MRLFLPTVDVVAEEDDAVEPPQYNIYLLLPPPYPKTRGCSSSFCCIYRVESRTM